MEHSEIFWNGDIENTTNNTNMAGALSIVNSEGCSLFEATRLHHQRMTD